MQALLRSRGFAFFGAPSIVAGLAVLPVLVSGYHAATGRARKIVRRAVLATAAVALVCIGLAAVAGVQARTKIQQAIHQAQAGFDAAQNGDRDTAMAQLSAADQSFASVSDQVDRGGHDPSGPSPSPASRWPWCRRWPRRATS